MLHLNEKMAEFVYGELSASEMNESRRHLGECSDCREQFEQFERTHHALKALPDVEPPRRIVFDFEKRSVAAAWISRWLGPVAASAAVAFAVVTLVPKQIPQPATPVSILAQQPAGQPPAAEPIDYDRIVRELRESERAWLVAELNRRDAVHQRDLTQIRAEIAYYEDYQRIVLKEAYENAGAIQLLAQRYEPKKE